MKLGKLLEKAEVSRRGLLKSIGAVAAAASMYGCSKNDDTSYYGPESSLSPTDNLVMDKTMKQCFSSGAYNCGARCVHKLQVKNGRIVKFTSAGDIPREGSAASDESIGENFNDIQYRACVRGYSYIQRLYQPDKLKYPLRWFGAGEEDRGKVECFKRVTWDNAMNAAVEAIAKAVERKAELGYTPLMIKWIGTLSQFDYFMDEKVAPCIHFLGNESTGAVDGAKYDAVGVDALTNNLSDRFNSKFIITWGLDPSRTTYHVAHAHWYNTKAREMGIPVVSITTNYNDSAAIIASGVPGYQYSRGGESKTVDIPGWIPCRPATDGALAAAMAYVIYKNDLYDHSYVDKDNGKSFGFFPGDECISTAPCAVDPGTGQPITDADGNAYSTVSSFTYGHSKNMKSPEDFKDEDGKKFKKDFAYTGARFKVPAGESFSEYLLSLEVDWAGAEVDANTESYLYKQPKQAASVGDASYKSVLNYAERLTGVPADVIEALAFKYAEAESALLDVGGGPQRAWNGFEWVWLMISLAAMTGNIDKAGGGAGFSMMAHPDIAAVGLNPAVTGGLDIGLVAPSGMLGDASLMNAIYIPMNNWAHLVLTGKDRRTAEQFKKDVKRTTSKQKYTDENGQTQYKDVTPVNLENVPDGRHLVEVDVWFMTENNIVTTAENINKNIAAIKKIPTVICLDQVMTPSALYSTIILPVTSHYEKSGTTLEVSTAALFPWEQAIDRLYDTRTDNEIKYELVERLNARIGSTYPSSGYVDAPLGEASLAAFSPSSWYKKATGRADAQFSYEDLVTKGSTQAVIPPEKDKTLVGFRDFNHCIPGKLENSTGKINFWSPLWGKIRKKTRYDVNTKDPVGRDITVDYNGVRNATASYQPHMEGYEKFFQDNDPRKDFTGFKSPLSGDTYRLYYMTNKARNRAHTVLDNVAMIKDEFTQVVKMNPLDAAERGIKDGDMVYVYNDRGCTKLPASVVYQIPPGVVSVEHGAWYRAHPTEKVKVWMQDDITEEFHQVTVPVDIGGAENILTLDVGTTEQYVGQATNAQSGPCEVSLTLPADRRA